MDARVESSNARIMVQQVEAYGQQGLIETYNKYNKDYDVYLLTVDRNEVNDNIGSTCKKHLFLLVLKGYKFDKNSLECYVEKNGYRTLIHPTLTKISIAVAYQDECGRELVQFVR